MSVERRIEKMKLMPKAKFKSMKDKKLTPMRPNKGNFEKGLMK